MTILYAAVIRDSTLIAGYSPSGQDFEKDLLKLYPGSNGKTEQVISSNNVFTYHITPTLCFACVTLQTSDRRIPLNFLDALSRRWASTIGPVQPSATRHSYDRHFEQSFGEFTSNFGKATEKTAEINKKLDETQELMGSALAKAYERGNELGAIDSKTEELLSSSQEFRTQATNLKYKMRCKHYKEVATWTLVVLCVIYLLLSWYCGGFTLKPHCIKPQTNVQQQ